MAENFMEKLFKKKENKNSEKSVYAGTESS